MKDFVNCGGISITKDRCIRTTFSKSHCRDCEDICIVDAVVFSPEPSINKNLCIKCGLCYSSCKFSAINIEKDNKQLLKDTKNDKEIDIGCIFSNSEIKITCLSRLTEDLLISWFRDKKVVRLKRGNCKRCKFKKTLSYFNKSFRKSVILAKAVNIKPNITIKTDVAGKVYIPKEGVSRRKMFSGLGMIVAKSTPKREILKDAIAELEIKEALYPDSADLSIDSTCTLCGVCEHVCPTKAIKIRKTENAGYIYFLPSSCINCNECEEACIYNSIEIKTQNVSFLLSKPKKVFEATKKTCVSCKKEFYSSDENEEMCHICSSKEDNKQQFLNFLKNL